MRGGGWGADVTRRQRDDAQQTESTLREGLKSLLAQCAAATHEDQDEEWLKDELSVMLHNHKPGTLLQQLKKLVIKMDQPAAEEAPVHQGSYGWPGWKQGQSEWTSVRRWSRHGYRSSSTGTAHAQEAETQWHEVRWRPRPQEFVAKHLFFDNKAFSDHLDAKDFRVGEKILTHAEDFEQAVEASALFAQVPGLQGTIFVTGRAKAKDDDEPHPWLQQASWIRAAGNIGGRVQVRGGWAQRIGEVPKQRSLCTAPAVKVGINRKREDSIVLRLVLDARFAEDWKAAISKPTGHARSWIQAALPSARTEVYDMWNFELHTDARGAQSIRGLVRVSGSAFAKDTFDQSGALHNGERWFVETLGHSGPISIRWVPWDGKELWDDYAARVRTEAGRGITLGRYQLGYRISEDEAKANPIHCMWVMDGVPPFLHVDEAEELMKAVGFDDIDIFTKGQHAWTFKATRSDLEEIVQGTAEDADGEPIHVVFTKCSRKRRARWNNVVPLRPSPAVLHPEGKGGGKGRGKSKPEASSGKVPGGDTPLGGDKSMEVDTEETADGKGGKRKHPQRESSAAETKPAHHDFKHWGYGGRVLKNDGGGNCLFYALAQLLKVVRPQDNERSHRQLREFVHACMLKNKARWEGKWDHTDSKGEATDKDFDTFLASFRKTGTWAGALELEAAAEALKLRVLAATSWGEVREFNPEASQTVMLFFDYTVGHWEAVLDADSQKWLDKKRAYEDASLKLDLELCGNKRMRGGVSHGSVHLSDFASRKGTSSPRLSDFASAVGSQRPSHTSSSSKRKRVRAATGKQPSAIQDGALHLKDVKAPVEQVVEALSKVKRSKTVTTMCQWIRSLGGTVQQVPALQGSVGNLRKRATSMWKIGQNFQIVHRFREKSSHRIVHIPCGKNQSKWGCSTCGRLWRRFSILHICLEDGIALDCQGVAARCGSFQSFGFRSAWKAASMSARDAFRKAFKMTHKEASLMELSDAAARAARRKLGPAASCVSIHRQVEAGRKRRAKLKKSPTSPDAERSSLGAQEGEAAAAPAPSGSAAGVDSSQFSWTCGVCKLTLEGQSRRRAMQKAWAHERKHHPHLRQRDAKKVAKFKGQFLWRCDVCRVRVLGANLRALQHQRSGHIQLGHPGEPRASFSTLTGKRGRANFSSLDQDPPSKRSKKLLLDRIKDDLLKDGEIESQPGPSSSSGCNRSFCIATLNVNGLANAYLALPAILESQPHAFVLQEVGSSHFETRKLQAHVDSHGYKAWWIANLPGRDNRTRGGVFFAVRRDIHACCIGTASNPEGEYVSVDFGGFVV